MTGEERIGEGVMHNEKLLVTQSSMPPYEEYIEAIKPLWNSRWITNMGCYHRELEERLKAYLDVPELSLMVNGHMALELTIQSFAFPEGAEVITTPFTFISTTHAIIRNHLQPVFCDVKQNDGTIGETKIENLITKNTVAIVPVHVYGNVCNVEAIQRIADRHHLRVIYDAAHAFGVKYMEKGIGSYGDASIFSFHATKVYHTIEGGAVACSERRIFEKLYNLKNFGIRGEELVKEVGANAKMNEFAAIMGLCNLNHIEEALANRRKRYEFYREKFLEIKGIRLFDENKSATRNYAYFPILIEDEYGRTRDEVYCFLRENDIYTRKYFYPLTADQICFKDKYKEEKIEIARELAKKVLLIPMYEDLEMEKADRIVGLMKKQE